MNLRLKRVHKPLRNMSDGSEYRPVSSPASYVLIPRSARRQLAFDIWWLAFALWLVCIIEVSLHLGAGIFIVPGLTSGQKSQIDRADTATWFNVFNIIFELVSAYGTVGLSLGSPTANYS
jgi:Trk-type K+ transport system membrane component